MHRIFKGFSFFSILVSIALVGGSTVSKAVVIERLEAAVNNHLILLSDLTRFRKTIALRSQLDPLFNGTPIAAAGERATDKEILEFLIDEKIIVQQFPMSESEVDQEVNSIQVNNHITREQLRQAITAQGFRFADYFDLIRVGAAKRNLIDREIRTKVTVSDDDVKNYYYGVYAKGKTAPQAFQVEMITQKDRSKIEAAHAAVKAGGDFAEVAKKYSEGASAETGGQLGVFTEETMDKNIREEMKKLKVGETSPVLGNEKAGYFFLRLASIQAGDDQKLKQVSDSIRAQLASGEYQRQLQLWLERQRQTAYIRRAGDAPAAGLPKGI
ncbi:MAG: peptidylprolyl isomerase [Cryobacterium sp.]|nr:peptidylprolyl isomerase [Oligoflexia bacterium]